MINVALSRDPEWATGTFSELPKDIADSFLQGVEALKQVLLACCEQAETREKN